LAHDLSKIKAIPPFREGNGRVQRLVFSQSAEHASSAHLSVLAAPGLLFSAGFKDSLHIWRISKDSLYQGFGLR
jgi:hypothetical protein